MILKSKKPLNKETRIEYAHFISAMINLPASQFLPFNPNEGDDFHWVLDVANNWRLKFYNDEQTLEITRRYGNSEVDSLGAWIAARLKMEII